MKIERATERDSNFIEGLLHIWEASVRETHDFLKYSDIDAIRNKYSKLSRKQDFLLMPLMKMDAFVDSWLLMEKKLKCFLYILPIEDLVSAKCLSIMP